ncbi:hypothetical protein SASPL_138166 [Salvia splendens]|uniref:EXPERA domain-containing protein n=1 Tax=Salvia splendens TaxID=180675 RepID=A0A8X8WV00_SALSN|nr:probable 3-beta-hydroxysteroid-Delta(8),Delta(7)-isomerase [Salvia splendens]XP_042015445.1 probable 3-beta-hydroxysteroid-Delta(8),Delta(7)-isomerase [Salvia splendens]KAG6401314.1 hypothetical protein SASPL_138166 [Salvia splendens]
MSMDADHPYVPRDLKLPGYEPVFLSQSTILLVYGAASLLVVSLMWLLSGRIHKISKVDRILMCWWIFTGLTHIILEGYFAFTPDFYKVNTPHYLAEVWKEYSKGDSRYVGRDSAVVAVEGITAAIEGPACLLVVYAIAKKKSYSYVLQLSICLGQLYGCLVYFATAILEGDNFATSMFYYYAYYVFANMWWVFIPGAIAARCWKKICVGCNVQEQKKSKTR